MLILALALTCLMFTVMITDITRFQIPNWAVIAITALYPACLYLAPVMPDWKIALLIALGTFALGFALFAVGIVGGGDVKLLAVAGLWAGKATFPAFDFLTTTVDLEPLLAFEMLGLIMLMGFFGGILTFALLLLRWLMPRLNIPAERLPRLLKNGEPVPYGVAIAVAFLILLWSSKIPGIIL